MNIYNFKETNKLILLFNSLSNNKSLSKYLLSRSKDKILSESYAIIKSPKFIYLYQKLIGRIKKEFKFDFYYQKFPSARVSQPGDNENPFHIDLWSGHGQNIINFWIPIVSLNRYNTLYTVDEINSKKLIDKHVKNDFDRNKFQKNSFKCAKPVLAKPGEVVVFSNKNIYGTINNISKSTRLSFDFRILKVGDDPGIRDINKFYECTKVKLDNKKKNYVHAMLYSKNSVSHISHVSQRNVIEDYCSRENLIPREESSEMHGLDTYPNINYHIKNKKLPLVLFSVKCLPKNKKSFTEIIKKLRLFKYEVHFALERKKLSEIKNNEILSII